MTTCDLRVPKGKARGEVYLPRPTQAKFHGSPAVAKLLLGGMGSGKSLSLFMEYVVQSVEEPRNMTGWKAVLARSTWEKLESATWPMFLECYPPEIRGLSKIRQRPYPQIILPNGAEVRGVNLDDPEKFGSEEYALQGIDECGENGVAEEHFLWMIGRRRSGIGRNNILLAGHPAGRNWAWKHFLAWQEDGSYKRNAKFEGWLTPSDENIHLDPEYLQMMRDTYPPEWIARYLSGEISAAEGQILTHFDPSVNLVPPVPLKDFWPRYRGLDHGLNHPTACSWTAVDLEGNLITYREHHRKNITPAENVAAILAASSGEEEMVQWTAYDPHMSQRQTAGGVIQALISQYEDAGLSGLRKGNDDIRASIVLMQSLLKPDPEHHFPYWHPLKGQLGAPHWYITTDCPRLRWEMEQWKYMDVKPGRTDREKAVDKDDDLIDTVRYVLMERPQQAVWTPPPSRNQVILDIIAEIAAEKSGGAGGKWIGEERLR